MPLARAKLAAPVRVRPTFILPLASAGDRLKVVREQAQGVEARVESIDSGKR
jgi:hypothetical protein